MSVDKSQKLKLLRIKHNKSQREVAKSIGVSAMTICKLESGSYTFTQNHIKILANFFNIEESFFDDSFTYSFEPQLTLRDKKNLNDDEIQKIKSYLLGNGSNNRYQSILEKIYTYSQFDPTLLSVDKIFCNKELLQPLINQLIHTDQLTTSIIDSIFLKIYRILSTSPKEHASFLDFIESLGILVFFENINELFSISQFSGGVLTFEDPLTKHNRYIFIVESQAGMDRQNYTLAYLFLKILSFADIEWNKIHAISSYILVHPNSYIDFFGSSRETISLFEFSEFKEKYHISMISVIKTLIQESIIDATQEKEFYDIVSPDYNKKKESGDIKNPYTEYFKIPSYRNTKLFMKFIKLYLSLNELPISKEQFSHDLEYILTYYRTFDSQRVDKLDALLTSTPQKID